MTNIFCAGHDHISKTNEFVFHNVDSLFKYSWKLTRVCFLFVDSKGNPRSMTNSKGKKRQVNGKELNSALKTNDALFVDFVHRCLEWVPTFYLTLL